MEEFKRSCPLPIFKKNEFTIGKQISGEGCRAQVFRSNIEGKSCISKLYDYEQEGFDDYGEFLEDKMDIFTILEDLRESSDGAIVQALGIVIFEENENIQIYLLTEDNQAIDLYSYIQQMKFWRRSSNEYSYSSYWYYEEGEDVYWSYIKEKEEKLQILRSMVKCVKELHDLNYIHLDIKNYNMVITKENEVFLIDYDSITDLQGQDNCELYIRCGTSGYCADEQWEYKASKKTDIYSLGVSMIEVWNGEIWGDSYDRRTCRNEVLKQVRIIEKNEPKLGKILRKCISPQEKNRCTTNKLWKQINRPDLLN